METIQKIALILFGVLTLTTINTLFNIWLFSKIKNIRGRIKWKQ